MSFVWANPSQAPIAVMEGAENELELLTPLMGGAPHAPLMVWDRPSPMSLRLILATLFHAVRTRNFRVAYVLALLHRIKPKIVVTYIDNSSLFYKVARLYKGARFLAIENGGRLLARDNPPGTEPIYIPEFACFGQLDADEFRRHGAVVGRYLPIGSLKDSYHRERCRAMAPVKRYDLCFVSQIKRQHYTVYPKTMESLTLLARHLRRFSTRHGVTLCVAARRHPEGNPEIFSWESGWYREHLGEDAAIIPNVPGEYTSYRLCDESRVSLAQHTTMLREAWGRGNRVLSCNFTGESQYDFPVAGPWFLKDPSYEAFDERLTALLNMPESEYQSACGDKPRYVIGYDPAQPTHVRLSRIIAEAASGMTGASAPVS